MKLHTGDQILVTAGKDKGRKGKVERTFPKKGRVLVPNINVYKRHRRGFGGQEGGVIEFSRPLPVSNVALICSNCGKQTRVCYRIDKAGEKVRVCAKCKKLIGKGGK